MRNAGLKNSNYCMTVVGVAPPLYVTCKILYICCCTVYNGAEELLRTHFVGILARETIV